MITDEMVEQRINSLREVHNNPEVYDLLKIVVRENMDMTTRASMLIAQGMREAAKIAVGAHDPRQMTLAEKLLAIHERAQELDPK